MLLPKIRTTQFELEEYGIGEGMKKPTHPALRDFVSFKLSVENCRITDVRVLFAIIINQLEIENEVIQKLEKYGATHPLQYEIREFLENILAEMKKVEGIDDLAYYVIKTR